MFTLWLWVAVALAGPSKAQWATAEAELREHLAGRELVEVAPKTDSSLGTAFWVRYAEGGSLVVVRGDSVFTERSLDTISAIAHADGLIDKQRIKPRDFLYLLQQLGEVPDMDADVITEHPTLGPRFVAANGQLRFVVYSYRSTQAEAEGATTASVTRAVLTIKPDYSMSWTMEDDEVAVKR